MEVNGWALSAKTMQTPEHLSLYPNPVTDLLKFAHPGPSRSTFEISIFDMNGKRVYDETILQTDNGNLVTMPVSHFIPGLYYLQLKNENRAFSGKFMKIRP
jgi:hypothetical protein